MGKFSYKNFCWRLGTTSFRTQNFNRNIEIQLDLLHQFWQLPQNIGESWSENSVLQANYYDFLKENHFLEGEADRKDKDARQKTSGLVSIGLIDDDRQLTNAGHKALQISKEANFSVNNALQLSKDSFLYLKQLLKTSINTDNGKLRPLIVTLYILKEHKHLSYAEFKYLLPLCTNDKFTQQISKQIGLLRTQKVSIDEIITHRLLAMSNYKEALEWFLKLPSVNQDDICELGMNRNSPKYDLPYFRLYEALKVVFLNRQKDEVSLLELYYAIKKLNLKQLWNKFIFNAKTISEKKIKKDLATILNETIFDNANDEKAFRTTFFKIMHLLKAKATLNDYADLNRRYLGLSDIFLFKDEKVELDLIPKYFFGNIINELYNEAFVANDLLREDCELNQISSFLILDNQTIINSINKEFKLNISTLDEAMSEYEKQRYARLNKLIDDKFSDEKLIDLLTKFENRDDKDIKEYITDNAEIPTIFEYILGIAWYKISERKGKILDYMKLSLDANLLPKTHAKGKEADIIYKYEESDFYPTHDLLLEATLSDKINQRKMELEPVSRHLGRHLLKTKNLNSYCVFATTHLDINVLSDFRTRKILPYYDTNDSKQKISGMKITAIQSTELKTIIANNKKYRELYTIFDEAYKADLNTLEADEWYQKYIVEKLQN